MRKFILAHEKLLLRALEILPGVVSWNIILFPYWGIFLFPTIVAYFILIFNIFWFYQSFQLAITATISHLRIQASMHYDWMQDVKGFPDWEKVNHIVVIPTFKEPIHILERTLNSLATQDLPKKMITVVLAMEAKEPETDRNEKVKILKSRFGKIFSNFYVTVNTLTSGEVVGKASNERYAAIWAKNELVNKKGLDINYLTITSCDADHKYHPKHFAYLTFNFLDNPKRYNLFWQPAVMFYINIW